jgi:drug/metabolite transporter (DMT)-like permease
MVHAEARLEARGVGVQAQAQMVKGPALLMPLVSAFLYAVAALCLKRGTERGGGAWRVGFVCNVVQALGFAPCWFLGGDLSGPGFWHAVACGACFFCGQVLTFLALSRGDVSLTTPVMGSKVLFVALIAGLSGGERLGGGVWGGAILTTLATVLLGGGHSGNGRPGVVAASFGFGFSAALAFAVTDVLVQWWAPAVGFGHFAPVMFGTVGALSVFLVPFFNGGLGGLAWGWVGAGASLLTLQAAGVAYAIIAYGSATLTNVLYNSRGIWSVVLVWAVGHWFSNRENEVGRGVMVRRLAGALLLLSAIVVATR